MRRYASIALLSALFVASAGAQTPAPVGPEAPDSRQLSADWQALINGMTHVAHGLEEYIQSSQRQIAQNRAESEAQKATLIEWLKAAQAEAGKPQADASQK